jgi:hypothetical protein
MTWIEALKKFNAGKKTWCIPKKGSSDYKEVIKLMGAPKTQKAKLKAADRTIQEAKDLNKEIDDLLGGRKKGGRAPSGPAAPGSSNPPNPRASTFRQDMEDELRRLEQIRPQDAPRIRRVSAAQHRRDIERLRGYLR